ncbi:MAG TPA: hypothetical protein VF311_03325 [Terriglobales bacterium]
MRLWVTGSVHGRTDGFKPAQLGMNLNRSAPATRDAISAPYPWIFWVGVAATLMLIVRPMIRRAQVKALPKFKEVVEFEAHAAVMMVVLTEISMVRIQSSTPDGWQWS